MISRAVNEDQYIDPGQPLIGALWGRDRPTFEQLLLSGVDVNGRGSRREGKELHDVARRFGGKWAALHVAAIVGDCWAIERLSARGADLNIRDCYSDAPVDRTALMFASEAGHTDAVEILCNLGASPTATTRREQFEIFNRWTALDFAAHRGHRGCIEKILSSCRERTFSKRALTVAGEHAIEAGFGDVVEALARAGGDREELLASAAAQGRIEIAEALVQLGASVPATEERFGGLIVSYLRAVQTRNSASGKAVLRGVKVLLKHGADPKAKDIAMGNTPLHEAVFIGPSLVRWLLRNEADPRVPDQSGLTPGEVALRLMNAPGASRSRMKGIASLLGEDHVEAPGANLSEGAIEGVSAADVPKIKVQLKRLGTSAGKRFRSLLAECREVPGVHNCLVGQTTGDSHTLWLREKDNFAREGHMLFLASNDLGLAHTTSPYDLIRAFGVDDSSGEVGTEDVVDFLCGLREDQEWELMGVWFSMVAIRFLHPVKNSRRLARRIHDFCDGVSGDVAALAVRIKESRECALIWD